MIRLLALTLTILSLSSRACGQISDSQWVRSNRDISKLALITRADHSAIFFTAPDGCGYARDGAVHSLGLKRNDRRPDLRFCVEFAVSHDGFHIAYAAAADSTGRSQIVVRDLRTGIEKSLTTLISPRLLSWSWDDSEIACRDARDLVAISVADGTKHILKSLPLWSQGNWPAGVSPLLAIEWLHHSPELVVDANPCLPTKRVGECVYQNQVLLWSAGASRMLTIGCCAAVSPSDDRIAYIGHDDKVLLIDADGSVRRTITTLPSALPLLPFLRESPWSRIVWSPKGDHLWLTTIIDEGGNTNVYLVDLRNGGKKKILKRTPVQITDWRR